MKNSYGELTMDKNVFAFTAAEERMPDYISINERNGECVITVRGNGGADVAEMVLPLSQMTPLGNALAEYKLWKKSSPEERAAHKRATDKAMA